MIQKERAIPIKILILEAILRRISETHPARAQLAEELGKRYAGYRGEQILDYYTKHLPLQKHHFIFHDLRLPISNQAWFQMDTLVLSPCYILILEGKHMAGKLHLEPQQLIRELPNVEESFPNPIIQIKNQQYFLKVLLEKHSFAFPSSDAFVVITNPKSIILPNPDYEEVADKVIRPQMLRFCFEQMEKKYNKVIWSDNDLSEISQRLLQLHKPDEPDLLNQYGIRKDELIQGIYCEDCKQFSIKRINRNWRCQMCHRKDEKAFIRTLLDYRLLRGDTISNREFRAFSHVSSIHIASKMLTSLNLPARGERKNRHYELSLDNLLSLL
ncbi:nuclease-related domain-containing protein [Bacillus sp. SD088]|uniref:nuclease-related domain-containing protein n=1 Tax=Bacillus sp. SD088 TaxID=2782012 RepID=UPI001A962D89|nr:nuclease-related domain-containing protein [Bacillus sp. SD088]MBO0992902.1 NERD domain-containing protein [Bacillus sp. SD088]